MLFLKTEIWEIWNYRKIFQTEKYNTTTKLVLRGYDHIAMSKLSTVIGDGALNNLKSLSVEGSLIGDNGLFLLAQQTLLHLERLMIMDNNIVGNAGVNALVKACTDNKFPKLNGMDGIVATLIN